MKITNIVRIVILSGAVAACQSPDVIAPVDPADVLLRQTEAQIYAPILLTRAEFESLTEMSQEMILAHNNVYWCRNEAKRPEGFDADLCRTLEDGR